MFKRCKYVFLSVVIILGVNLQAQSAHLEIRHARINATTPGMQTTAAYFDLVNHTNDSVVLESASSDISDRVELHEHKMHDGLMQMQRVNGGISIKAGETVHFKPGGYHIMLMNLEGPVEERETITIVLHFADGKAVTFEAAAQKPSSATQHHSH